jgi:hypothetical protein
VTSWRLLLPICVPMHPFWVHSFFWDVNRRSPWLRRFGYPLAHPSGCDLFLGVVPRVSAALGGLDAPVPLWQVFDLLPG